MDVLSETQAWRERRGERYLLEGAVDFPIEEPFYGNPDRVTIQSGDLALVGILAEHRTIPAPLLGVISGIEKRRKHHYFRLNPFLPLQNTGSFSGKKRFPVASFLEAETFPTKHKRLAYLITGSGESLAEIMKEGKRLGQRAVLSDWGSIYQCEAEWVKNLRQPYNVALARLMVRKSEATVRFYESRNSK